MATGLQVVDNLCLFNSRQLSQGLDLHDHRIEAYQIGTIRRGELLPLVVNGQFDLSPKGYLSFGQLPGKCFLIDRLQEAWPSTR